MINVFIVDDAAEVRQRLKQIVEDGGRFEVSGEAETVESAIEAFARVVGLLDLAAFVVIVDEVSVRSRNRKPSDRAAEVFANTDFDELVFDLQIWIAGRAHCTER